MRRLAVALLLLGCDAAEEGRGPGVYAPGFTTSTSTSTSGEDETSTSSGGGSTSSTSSAVPLPATTTSADETTGSTSNAGDTTGTTTGSTTGEPDTTSSGTTTGTTGPDTTTGGELPCPCLPGIQAGQNVCAVEPTPDCPATMPGGICDPNGDGAYNDADWIAGYKGYLAACG